MKISLSLHSLKRMMEATGMNYFQACDLTKELGFDGIEFNQLRLEIQPEQDCLILAQKIREYCAQIELPIVSYTVGPDPLQFTQDQIKEQVDIAAALGAPVMRYNSCRKCPDGMTWRDVVKKITPVIRAIAEYAETKGVKTCTENHGQDLQDAERVEELMLAVHHRNFGWLVDLGNFLCADDNPLRAVPIAAPYAFHAHVKDFLYKPADSFFPGKEWFRSRNGAYLCGTMLGHGIVPIPACIRVLYENGYNGYISYEYEGKEETRFALECGIDYIKRILSEIE